MKRQFTISRKKWLRGTNTKDGDSYLKHPKKPLFCCLGLIATQCGVPTKAMSGVGTPEKIKSEKEKEKIDFLLNKFGYDLRWVNEAVGINDNEKLTEAQREKNLDFLFKRHNIELTFTE